MSRHRIWTLILAIASLILISVPASREAQATATASATASKALSSGIGLAANLPGKGVKVLRNSTYYERALKSILWDPTPSGMVYHSCVYHVPNGAYVDSIHGRITLPDGRVQPMRQCPYPRLTPSRASPATKPAAAGGATLSGNYQYWVDGFEADRLPHLYHLYASLAAPYPPNVQNISTNWNKFYEYQWTALYAPSAYTILQPAVGWGRLTINKGSNQWRYALNGDTEMASYYYWNGNVATGPFYSVKPLDTIQVSINGSNCGSGGGGCTWLMQMVDTRTGQDSQLKVSSSPAFTSVVGELESNVGLLSGINCQWLFANHHLVWRHLYVKDQSGANVTPSSTSYYQTGWYDKNKGPGQKVFNVSNMNANWNTTNGQTAADITWDSSCPTF